MRFLSTLILGLVLVGVLLLIHFFGGSGEEKIEAQTPLFPGLTPSDVSRLEMSMYLGQKVVLERTTAAGWRIVEPFKDSARAELVKQVLDGLAQNTRLHVPLSATERDLPSKGLEPPEHHLTFTDSRGEHTLYIGTRDPMRSETYVMIEGDDRLYRTGANVRNFLEQNPMDLRDDRLFRIDPLLVNELSIVGPKGLIIQARKQTGYWEILGPVRANGDSGNVQNVIARLTTLRERQRMYDGPLEEAILKEWGFKAPRYTLTMRAGPYHRTVHVESMGLGPHGDPLCIREGEEAIVSVSKTDLEWILSKSLSFYRSKELLKPVRDSIQRLRIHRLGRLTLELNRLMDGKSFAIAAPFKSPADNISDGNTTPVFHFLTQIDGLRVHEFVADGVVDLAAFGLDTPAVEAEFLWETGGSKKKARLLFGTDDGSGLVPAVRADGPGPYSVCKVKAEDLASLYKDAILLRDRRIFPPDTDFVANVRKVTFSHKRKSITIERNEGDFFEGDPNSRFQEFLNDIKRELVVRFLAGPELYDSPFFLELQGSMELTFKEPLEGNLEIRIDFGGPCDEGFYGRMSPLPQGIFIVEKSFIQRYRELFQRL